MFRTAIRALGAATLLADLSVQLVLGFGVGFVGLTLALPILDSVVPLPTA